MHIHTHNAWFVCVGEGRAKTRMCLELTSDKHDTMTHRVDGGKKASRLVGLLLQVAKEVQQV